MTAILSFLLQCNALFFHPDASKSPPMSAVARADRSNAFWSYIAERRHAQSLMTSSCS